jgi:hypothetical protein
MTRLIQLFVCLLAILALPSALAQQTFNNDSVIKMVKMGFPEDMIINAINRSPGTYDTSPDGLIALKNAGVGNRVVSAMVSKTSEPPPSPALQAIPATQVTPTAPAPGVQSFTAGSAPTRSGNRPRVFLQSQSHGNLWNATRDQSMEMSKDFERSCPDVRISINQNMADYTVALNHVEHGFARDNQIQVANKDGDLISTTKEGGSIKGDVKKACDLILADWAKN